MGLGSPYWKYGLVSSFCDFMALIKKLITVLNGTGLRGALGRE